ncbi:MAG TPA: class I SAM-dependent methyltransferase, partial [Terriglobales bacterium]|nr:class I SAM-dependent methyltransferase [Terriglobales bacterium]
MNLFRTWPYHRIHVRNGQPTVTSELIAWWREHRPRAGFIPTARALLAIGREFVRDSMPDRVRQRYGDVDYDWEHRVDTTSANVSWRARFIGLLNSSYQPIESPLFQEILNSLGIDYRQFTFIDIGSGKGRPLLMASEYPFKRIIGVEFLPELNAIAEANIRKFPDGRKKCKQIEARLADATDFQFPSEPIVVFMFHPLTESGFRRVIANLVTSARQNPRPIWLVYANPLFEEIVFKSDGFRKTVGTEQYTIFAAQRSGN